MSGPGFDLVARKAPEPFGSGVFLGDNQTHCSSGGRGDSASGWVTMRVWAFGSETPAPLPAVLALFLMARGDFAATPAHFSTFAPAVRPRLSALLDLDYVFARCRSAERRRDWEQRRSNCWRGQKAAERRGKNKLFHEYLLPGLQNKTATVNWFPFPVDPNSPARSRETNFWWSANASLHWRGNALDRPPLDRDTSTSEFYDHGKHQSASQ